MGHCLCLFVDIKKITSISFSCMCTVSSIFGYNDGVKQSTASGDSPEIFNKNSHPDVENSPPAELGGTNKSSGTKKPKKINKI